MDRDFFFANHNFALLEMCFSLTLPLTSANCVTTEKMPMKIKCGDFVLYVDDVSRLTYFPSAALRPASGFCSRHDTRSASMAA